MLAIAKFDGLTLGYRNLKILGCEEDPSLEGQSIALAPSERCPKGRPFLIQFDRRDNLCRHIGLHQLNVTA